MTTFGRSISKRTLFQVLSCSAFFTLSLLLLFRLGLSSYEPIKIGNRQPNEFGTLGQTKAEITAHLRSFRTEFKGKRNPLKKDYGDENAELLCEEIYKNLSEFQRSYEQMQKTFKIYSYKDGYIPLIHQGPRTGIYASEGLFMDVIERGITQFLTDDPEKAHMFFLPYSVRNMVTHLQDPHSRSMKIIRRYIAYYVRHISHRYPFWNRTKGRDHFFVSCHDWAIRTLKENEDLKRYTVKVVCDADKSAGFQATKDVSLPEIVVKPSSEASKSAKLDMGGPPPSNRQFLVFFAGQMHGDLRPKILGHWGPFSSHSFSSIRIFEARNRLSPSTGLPDNLSYTEYMKASKYCLCPRGFDVNSPRLVESIYYDCVPVIISDEYVLPFSDVLDWEKLAVRIDEKDVPLLSQILERIPHAVYESMQRRLQFVRRHFIWHPRPVKFDVFNMVMYSLWVQGIRNNLWNDNSGSTDMAKQTKSEPIKV